jgi:hypothetical protein
MTRLTGAANKKRPIKQNRSDRLTYSHEGNHTAVDLAEQTTGEPTGLAVSNERQGGWHQ